MTTKKMSFESIRDVMSKDEMRKIMAGSDGFGCRACQSNDECTFGSYCVENLHCGNAGKWCTAGAIG